VCFTNDRVPRAINPDGSLKRDDDWDVVPILVRRGARRFAAGQRAYVGAPAKPARLL